MKVVLGIGIDVDVKGLCMAYDGKVIIGILKDPIDPLSPFGQLDLQVDPRIRKELYVGCQKMIAKDAVNGFLFVMPSLPTMKKEVMNWWKDYPILSVDVTEAWIQK